MLVSNKNLQGYKENVIFLIAFAFEEGVTIIDFLSTMKLYKSDIEESYKDTIIGNPVNSGTANLWLHIVQCWCLCSVDELNWSLPMVL